MTATSMTKEELAQQYASIQTFVLLTSLADADIVTSYPAPFDGEIVALRVIVSAPATTGSKACTLTAKINGNAVSGTALATTSANMTPLGKVNSATATTGHASAQFTAGDLITVSGTSTTSFVEGSAMIVVEIRRKG